MEQQPRPLFVTTESVQSLPLLIIDKAGDLGINLVEKLKDQFLIVFVTGLPREKINEETLKKIILIPYSKKIPMIPDNIYSHIFAFYDGEKETLEILPSLLKKAEQTKAKLLFITSLVNHSQELHKHLQFPYHKFEVIIYGEIFSNEEYLQNPLSVLIRQAKITGALVISGMGLKKAYPIFIEDVIAGIIAVGFALDKKRKLVYLFPSHPSTEISLARMLQKIDPLLKIDFKKEKEREVDSYIPPNGEYIFHEYDLERRLKRIDLTREEISEPPSKRKVTVGMKKKRQNQKFIYIGGIALITIIPLLITLLSASIGAVFVSESVKSVEAGNISVAGQQAQTAKLLFNNASAFGNTLILLNVIAPQVKDQLLTQIATGQEISQTDVETLSAIASIKDIIGGRSLNPQSEFLHAIAIIKNSLITLQKIRAEKTLPKDILAKLENIEYPLTLSENIIDSLPLLLGFNSTKQYLILFQNNMELRPGGGFIGSYGLLNLHNGQVNSFKVYDVYDADGKLTQNIDPPFALNRYLGASHWFLRDSNFDIDFSKDAQTASNFLELETGQKVDGIIAIDTDFLKKILEGVGSISVPDYKETVTPDNFYLLTQNHAEKNFFPGSTQKKDFLSSLYDAIFLQLNENRKISKVAIINKIGEAMREKHILFSFPDKSVQELFIANDLSGTLWDGRSKSDNGVLDLVGINEANLGTNKVNYYLKRNIDQKIKIDDQGRIQSSITITYQNTSGKGSPYGGDYKNYLRFILPNGAQLQDIVINGSSIPMVSAITDKNTYSAKDFVPPSGIEVEQTQEQGDAVYGFLVSVPTGETKTVTAKYTIPPTVNINRSVINYSLKIIKQPGTEDDPYSLTLEYPAGFKLFQSSPTASDVGGKTVYNGNLSADQIINIALSK
jgi:hypothetical protein